MELKRKRRSRRRKRRLDAPYMVLSFVLMFLPDGNDQATAAAAAASTERLTWFNSILAECRENTFLFVLTTPSSFEIQAFNCAATGFQSEQLKGRN